MNALVARHIWLGRKRATALTHCLFVAGLAVCAPVAAQSVTTTVYSRGDSDPVPEPQTTTQVPGETVTDSSSASFLVSNHLGTASGTALGSSLASTNYGLNRAAVAGDLVGYNGDFGAALAYTQSYAYSRWTDTLVIGGGAAGDLVNLSFSGRTTYSLQVFGGAVAVPPAVSLNQDFFASGSLLGGGQVSFSTADFASNASLGFLDWTLNFAGRSGDSVLLGMVMNMYIEGGNFGGGLGSTNKRVVFDSSNTALLTRLDVTDGYSLTSASGELVAHDGAFAYSAVLAAVPEPETYGLMLVGLGILGFVTRHRRRETRNAR